MTVTAEITEDCRRRLVNQKLFPEFFVECSCERGCAVCAYTARVSKACLRPTTIESGKASGST